MRNCTTRDMRIYNKGFVFQARAFWFGVNILKNLGL